MKTALESAQHEAPAIFMKSTEPYHRHLEALSRDTLIRKGKRTRLRLMAAAANILQDEFFHSMRITDICSAADVSQGTFYLYFKDKTQLTTTLLSEFTQGVYKILDESRRTAGTAQDTIFMPTLAYVEIFQVNRGLMRCLILLSEESSEFETIFRDLSASWNHRAAKGIQRRLGKPDNEFPECLATAYALASMVDEFLAKLYVRKDPNIAFLVDDPKRVANMLSEIWLRTVTLHSFSR